MPFATMLCAALLFVVGRADADPLDSPYWWTLQINTIGVGSGGGNAIGEEEIGPAGGKPLRTTKHEANPAEGDRGDIGAGSSFCRRLNQRTCTHDGG